MNKNILKYSYVRLTLKLLILILFILIVQLSHHDFLNTNNINILIKKITIHTLIALGVALVIFTNGIDFSIGATFVFCGSLPIVLMNHGLDTMFAITLTLIIGSCFGAVNGFLITFTNLKSYIITLITMTFMKSITLIITNGKPIVLTTKEAKILAQADFLGLPSYAYTTIGIIIILSALLSLTKFGKNVYMLGKNIEVPLRSKLATKLGVHSLCAFLAGLAGIIETSIVGATPIISFGWYELDTFASLIIGGISLYGGAGTIIGVLFGSTYIAIINNGFTLIGLPVYYQMLIKASIIIISLAYEIIMKRKI